MVSVAGSDLARDEAADFPLPPSRAALAWRDLASGFAKSWMWTALAVQDVKLRYRGSALGPFWLTISTAIMVAAMGLIYARLFHTTTAVYVPYLTLGLVVWQFLANTIVEGCDTFIRQQSVIQQVPIPFSIQAYRLVARNFIVLAHTIVIVPVVLAIWGIAPGWRLLEVIPAVALLAVNGVWISLLLGLVSTRFRDVPPIVSSFLQVVFFLTPAIWPIDALGEWRGVATWNPLFAAIDVVRSPVLGAAPAESSWFLLIAWTVLGSLVTFALFARFRSRIAYWI